MDTYLTFPNANNSDFAHFQNFPCIPELVHSTITSLHIDNIKHLDTTLFTSKLQNLEVLYLRNLEITNLDFISECTSLVYLELNNIYSLKRLVISKLQKLEILYMKDLELTNLDFISECTSLISLTLNRIYSLTSLTNIKFCTNLTSLSIIDIGYLKSIDELRFCTQLSYLYLDTPIDSSPLVNLRNLELYVDCPTYDTYYEIPIEHSPILSNMRKYYKYYHSRNNFDAVLNYSDIKVVINGYYSIVKLILYASAYLNLLSKYNELSKFSTDPSFVQHIQDFTSDLTTTHRTYDDELAFVQQAHAKLKDAYKKLKYAPHGPIYAEVSKLYI